MACSPTCEQSKQAGAEQASSTMSSSGDFSDAYALAQDRALQMVGAVHISESSDSDDGDDARQRTARNVPDRRSRGPRQPPQQQQPVDHDWAQGPQWDAAMQPESEPESESEPEPDPDLGPEPTDSDEDSEGQRREENLHRDWQRLRPTLMAAAVASRAVPHTEQLCSSCGQAPAVVACSTCREHHRKLLCGPCDAAAHPWAHFHRRAILVHGFFQPIPASVNVNADGSTRTGVAAVSPAVQCPVLHRLTCHVRRS